MPQLKRDPANRCLALEVVTFLLKQCGPKLVDRTDRLATSTVLNLVMVPMKHIARMFWTFIPSG